MKQATIFCFLARDQLYGYCAPFLLLAGFSSRGQCHYKYNGEEENEQKTGPKPGPQSQTSATCSYAFFFHAPCLCICPVRLYISTEL